MMGDEVLGSLDDPGEVADAQLAAVSERGGDRQPGRITEGLGSGRRRLGNLGRKPAAAQGLGAWEVEAQKVATLIAHNDILTSVGMWASRAPPLRAAGPTPT